MNTEINQYKNRIEVIMSYNKQVITNFKLIEGRNYNSITRTWNFPLESLKQVIDVLRPFNKGFNKINQIDKELEISKFDQFIVIDIIDDYFYIDLPLPNETLALLSEFPSNQSKDIMAISFEHFIQFFIMCKANRIFFRYEKKSD